MRRIWILIISVCSSKYVHGDYVTTQTAGILAHMMEVCTFASPPITYGVDNTVDIGTDNIQIDEGDKLWVGYTQDYEVFRFIGCIAKDNVYNDTVRSMKADIGDCYSTCGTAMPYFGVSGSSSYNALCYCISDAKDWNVTACGNNIPDRDFAFGGPSTLALYERVSLNIKSIELDYWNRTDSNCFSYYDKINGIYRWENCSKFYFSLCTSSLNGIVSNKSSKAGHWKLAADRCVRPIHYLTSYHQNITTNATAQLWTANIRAKVISKTRGRNKSMFLRYGYVERNGSSFTLKFARRDSGYIYKALCLTGTINSSRDVQPPTDESSGNGDVLPQADESSGNGTTIPDMNVSPQTDESSGNGTTIPDMNVPPQTDESSGNVGAYVGASVAVVIVIAAVVVVIVVVILRKRRKPSDDKEVNNMRPNLTYDSQQIQSSSEPNKAQTDDYNEIGDIATLSDDYDVLKDDLPLSPHNSSNNQYSGLHKIQTKHVVEPKTAMRNEYDYVTDTAQEHNNTGHHDYFVLEKDPGSQKKESKKQDNSGYDFAIEAGTEFPRDRDDIEHCYNTTSTTNNVDCDNYDHISKGRDQFSGEQPYDTTLQWGARKKIDPNYDHTGAYQGQDEPYSTCGQKSPIEKEDLYNKLVKPS